MPVSTQLVQQYYTGILRLPASTAVVNQLANSSTDLASLTVTLLNMATNTVDPVVRLYQAAFNRVPDNQGLTNQVGVFKGNIDNSGTLTLTQMASSFTGSQEFIANYGLPTTDNTANTKFVASLYTNVLGRTTSGGEEQGWIDFLNKGGSRDTVLNGFAQSPEFIRTTAAAVDTFLTGAGAGTATYTGTLNSYGPVTTYTLTTGIDTFTGGINNDVFDGQLAISPTLGTPLNQTLNPLDRLDGGAGINTLNAQINTTVTPIVLSNIQIVNASMTDGTPTLNLVNAAQLTTLSDIGSAVSSIYTGLAAGAVNLNVADSTVGGRTTFGYTTTTGAQSVNLGVSNIAAVREITLVGIETINVTSTGNASLYRLDADAATALNFAGASAQTVTMTADTDNVTSFNAAATTGGINLTVVSQAGVGTADVSVTGGSGNDTLTLTAQTTNDNSVTGGAGNDTFVFGANLFANQVTGSANDTIVGGDGFDTLSATTDQFIAADNTVAGAIQSISGIEAITVSDILDANLVLSRIQAGIQRVTAANSTTANSITFDSGVAGTLSLTSILGGTQTLVSAGSGTTDSLTISNGTAGTNVFNSQALVATSVETLTLGGTTTTTRLTQGVGTIGATSGTTAVVFTGNNSFVTGAITAGSVNASGLTGSTAALTLNAATVGVTSIIGSANADILRGSATATSIDGGAGNDTITGGAAADAIDGGAGADSINGGGGNDTIRGGEGNDEIIVDAVGSVSIDGGAGNDFININNTLNTGDAIDGGAGVNTLAMTTALIANFAGVTNIQTLSLTGVAAQNLARFTGTTLTAVTDNTAAGVTALTGASASLNTLNLGAATMGTLSFARAANTSTDTLTVASAGAAGVRVLNSLTVNNENTLNFAQGAMLPTQTLTIAQLSAIDVTQINITGNQNTSVSMAALGAAIGYGNVGTSVITRTITIDASAAAGTVTFNGTNALATQTQIITGSLTAASTLTGGLGNDTITLGNAATGNSVSGGEGNDIITGGSGADLIRGDLGADVIIGGGGADTINGGADSDQLTGGSGIDRFNQASLTDSTARTASTFATTTVAAGDSITFANGLDVITDFAAGAGGDVLLNLYANGALPTSLIGETVINLTDATEIFFASGSYDSLTGRFVISANGVGADTLIVQANNATEASDSLLTNTSMVVLVGVDSDNLAVGNFVA